MTTNTQVYRKKTHTDQLLNYNNNHPTQHKISCIKTLFNRIDTHCNTDQSKQEERKYLYSTFYKNYYPTHFINKVLSCKKQTNINQTMKNKKELLHYTYTQRWKWRPDYFDHSTLTLRINQSTNLGLILPNTRTKHTQRTNTMPSICLTVLIVQKDTLAKHQKRYRQD